MSLDKYYDLMAEADQLNASPTKTSILEQAVREAELAGDIEAAYESRMQVVDSATFGGQAEKALNAFTWCLAQYDDEQPFAEERRILWRFKWVAGSMSAFPTISRKQIESMQTDMEHRFVAAGYGMRSVYKERWSTALEMGDHEKCENNYAYWQAETYDSLTDCDACDTNAHVYYHCVQNDYKSALCEAEPLIDGSERCSVVPRNTFGNLILPAILENRLDDAEKWHERGYPDVRRNPDAVSEQANHLLFLIAAGRLNKAISLFENNIAWAVNGANPEERCHFYVASQLLCEAADKQRLKRPLRLPQGLLLNGLNPHWSITDIGAWFCQQVNQIAGQFDKRNQNKHCTKTIDSQCELIRQYFANIRA